MDVKNQVRQYIVDSILMSSEGSDLADHTSLIEHNILDSTGVLELVAFLEETFQIQVADADLVPANLDTLNAIAAYVERRRAASAGHGLQASGYRPEPERSAVLPAEAPNASGPA
jgi:acyl carrier protein